MPQNVPIPETPVQRSVPSLRFQTSTPFGRTPGMETTMGAGEDSILDSAIPSPDAERTSSRPEIKLPDKENHVVLDTKKLNIEFKGTEVEKFITRVEKLAALQQAGGQDVALQLPFMMKDQKISESIENMEGHETRDWELLKKEMIRKWGRATPLRRFDKRTIPTLISKYEDKGGIQTKEDYRTFIGELEEVLVYLLKMGYQDVNAESGEPLWKAISWEIRKEVARELAHDKKLRKTKDGQNLVPKLEELKDYVEATLSITDLELAGTKVNVACKTATESKKEAKVQPKEEESSQKFKEMEEEIKQLHTVVNTNQNMRTLPPHFSNPRPQNPVYRPPGTGAPPFPRPPVQCFYCRQPDHTSMFCPGLTEDIGKRMVYKQGPNYYYPNREPIPTDTSEPVRDLVRKFAENAANVGTQEPQYKKANMTEWDNEEDNTPMPSASVISTNRWEAWSPPEVYYGEEEEENLIGFGLRRSQRNVTDKDKDKEKPSQPTRSKPDKPENSGKTGTSDPRTPPPNQEANKNPQARKRRLSYPGAWVEGESEDDSSEEESTKDMTEESVKEPEKKTGKAARKETEQEVKKKAEPEVEKKAEQHSVKEVVTKIVEKSKIGVGLKKKILKQSFTLTLEELLLISPNFLTELQEFTGEDNRLADRTQNSGKCDHRDFEDEESELAFKPNIPRNIHQSSSTYACPLGFVNITINGKKIRALVDTGAEMNIMPEFLSVELQLTTRQISMNIMGIGGHSTPIVGLAEGVNFNIIQEEKKSANFFIARGKVYTVLGRPFLADHGIRLELSKARGEILSYELWDGERLCIPICSPKIPGWESTPPRRINDRCCNIQTENYTDQGRDISGVSDNQDAIMDTEGKAELEGNKETEIIDEVVKALSELQLSESNDMDILNISTTQDYMDLDEDYRGKSEMELCEEWTTPEHPAAWENWNTDWTITGYKPDESHYLGLNACSIAADYVDQGYPYEEFLRLYPETYGSTAGGLWEELPGYDAGRIGFTKLLNWEGTMGYLNNHCIWPGKFWITSQEWQSVFMGGPAGAHFIREQKMWDAARDREKEEEDFLANIIAKMVLMIGKLDWEAFKWLLMDEQRQLGENYETFWKAWEFSE
ncbi:hypothetical protein MJO29_006019 [Puccinia striiformis f. sp. tritici]|nr:hypothetical protein MJO29_006019 [Puccinia striiformis f. sp. tritici]